MQKHRESLAAIAAGGQAKQYVVHGKAYTADQIDALDNTEIEKLCGRYEAMKTLGSVALRLYTGLSSAFLTIPVKNQGLLLTDLEGDPFVGHALGSATCELYHRCMFLALLISVLTTFKHCQICTSMPCCYKQ